jgi:hypothetical protein
MLEFSLYATPSFPWIIPIRNSRNNKLYVFQSRPASRAHDDACSLVCITFSQVPTGFLLFLGQIVRMQFLMNISSWLMLEASPHIDSELARAPNLLYVYDN